MLNRVEAIIFIDCMRPELSHADRKRTKGTSNTNLCDLLNISDRLEAEFELSEGGHVSGILRSGVEDRPLGRNAGESPPCEHYGRYNKKRKSVVSLSGILAHGFSGLAVWLIIRAERRSFGISHSTNPRLSQV